MSLYSRARKHIDMKRVKEIREEKIKEQKISKLIERQLEIAAELKEIEREESKYCDWRKELEEGMTTAGLGMINLPGQGDVDLVDLGNETPNQNVQPGATNNGGTYTFGPVTPGYGFASTLAFSPLYFDLSQVDTVVFNFTAGDITSFAFTVNRPGNTSVYNLSTSSGIKVITLRQSDRIKNAGIAWTLNKNQGDPVGTNRISGVALQRRRPMNVLVSLDDPEANSFIRGGLGGSEERKAKLKDMLEAGNELMIKLGLEPSKTSPGDIELDPVDTGKDYGEIAAIYQSPDGTYQSFPGSVNPNKDTSKWPSINDKPKPVKWPTPGIFPGQLPRV